MLRHIDRCLPLNTRTIAVEQHMFTRATPVPETIQNTHYNMIDTIGQKLMSDVRLYTLLSPIYPTTVLLKYKTQWFYMCVTYRCNTQVEAQNCHYVGVDFELIRTALFNINGHHLLDASRCNNIIYLVIAKDEQFTNRHIHRQYVSDTGILGFIGLRKRIRRPIYV